jgi:DNA primase
VDRLSLESPDLRRLRTALLDAVAHEVAHEREALTAAIGAAGLGDVLERAQMLVRRANQWPALPEAAFEDAREAFLQALHLHRSAGTLHRELKAAEQALANEPTEENYRHLVEIQAQLRNVQATEALIEGFGILSGRTGRS